MYRQMSRAQRKAVFLEKAAHMYGDLEEWYDQHPKASFGEIETETRRLRRELMGEMLAVLINGRDTGYQLHAPPCEVCGQALAFKGHRPWGISGLEGETTLLRAYYVCPDCEGETFFPLDRKLLLRADHWSEGAARVAGRQGLLGKSFALAAEGWGRMVDEQRAEAAERANARARRGESPQERRIVEVKPIAGQANLSTDGGMVLVRGEGWKEVKLTTISEVEVRPAEERPAEDRGATRRAADLLVKLKEHSYQAGLWDADTMALHQYTEGLRRGLDQCPRLSSVNDGASWIERITGLNFSEAVQIVDWPHAKGKLWKVGKAVFGEQSPAGKEWVEERLDHLWAGEVQQVEAALEELDLEQERWPDGVRQATGYFEGNRTRMRYDEFRAEGYPIGSGTVESGINTVVHHRMKRPGRGWERSNGQAMLAGLSELHSGRFDQAWKATLPLAA